MQRRQPTATTPGHHVINDGWCDRPLPSRIRPSVHLDIGFCSKIMILLEKPVFQTLMNLRQLVDTPINYAESVAYDRCLETIETDFLVLDVFFQKKYWKFALRGEILENAPQIDEIGSKSLKIIYFR